MAATTFPLSGSRAGVGSTVVTTTGTKTFNVADIGVVQEGGGASTTTGQTVQVLVLA